MGCDRGVFCFDGAWCEVVNGEMSELEGAWRTIFALKRGDSAEIADDDPRAAGYMMGLLFCSAHVGSFAFGNSMTTAQIVKRLEAARHDIIPNFAIGSKLRDGFVEAAAARKSAEVVDGYHENHGRVRCPK